MDAALTSALQRELQEAGLSKELTEADITSLTSGFNKLPTAHQTAFLRVSSRSTSDKPIATESGLEEDPFDDTPPTLDVSDLSVLAGQLGVPAEELEFLLAMGKPGGIKGKNGKTQWSKASNKGKMSQGAWHYQFPSSKPWQAPSLFSEHMKANGRSSVSILPPIEPENYDSFSSQR